MIKLKRVLLLLTLCASAHVFAQDITTGTLSGNFQMDGQYYSPDSLIGADKLDNPYRTQGYMNLIYNWSNFETGFRYENYMEPLLGFDPKWKGSGIPYRYITYRSDVIDVTAGNFYEQFGSGMILRAYEEKMLGVDNNIDGLRVKVRPLGGMEITGLIGRQRDYWDLSTGIVRAGDIKFDVNQLIAGLLSDDYQLSVAGSFVSKFEEDLESFYNLPENVFAYSARASLVTPAFSLDGEWAYKLNDPNATNVNPQNKPSFNPGTGLIVAASVFGDGLGATVNFHRVDNMNFRSERNALGNELTLSYVPPLTRQHTYRLATLYPYATQINGEIGVQAEVNYMLPRGSDWGGEYGTNISVNYSRVHNIDTSANADGFTYQSEFFAFGDKLLFQDFNIEVSRKFSEDFKASMMYINLTYDKDVIENGGAKQFGLVSADFMVLEMLFQLSEQQALRTELSHIWAKNEHKLKSPDNINGNWAMFLAEYTIAPSFYFTLYDEFNYGNEFEERQLHYLNGSFAYLVGTTRMSVGYGRQRGGLLCVGGICRPVPAANGFSLSVSSTF